MKLKRGIYRHYKGQEYALIGVGRHSETLEEVVVYECAYENEFSKLWVRPIEIFMETVTLDGVEVPRFQHVAGPMI